MSILEKIKEISSIKTQEKQVLDILEDELIARGWFTKGEIKVVRIEPNLFSVGTEKNISFYCDEKGNISFNIWYIRKQPFFDNFLFTAGLSEKKNTNGEYELFRIIRDNSGKKDEEVEIPLYSKEYFSAWEDIIFYKDKFTIDLFKRRDRNGNYHSFSDEKIQNLYQGNTLRMRDLVLFFERKQVSKKAYEIYIPKLADQIPVQINDLRFNKIEDNVTFSEIQDYFKKKLITKEMFDMLNKQIKSRDELLLNTESQKQDIKNNTSSTIDNFKESLLKK